MNAERLLTHYEQIADAPDAIARLRRFILDLAVRGKLVPQDPTDEPASELLKRIAEEKARLDRKERTKREPKNFNGGDEPIQMPKGWALAPLADLVTVLNGRAYKQNELLSAGTPVLRVGNLFTSDKWYYSTLQLDEDKYCAKGDLIFAWSASFGPFIWDGEKVIYHYHIWKLPLHSESDLNKRYLYNFLLQKTREIKEAGHGISMVHMTKEKMEKLVVPVPPLAEQHRIVAKVDELMALCDRLEAARESREAVRDRFAAATFARLDAPYPEIVQADARFALDALPALTARADQIKQLRQTIRNLAVRGKLVPQDANDEPASVQYDAPELEGRLDTEIPPNWRWVRVEDVAEARLGKMLDKAKNKGRPYPYLRNTNVHWFDIRLDDLKTIPLDDAEFEEYQLKRGDVLICEGGHGIGRTAVWGGGFENLVFQKALHRVRPSAHLDSRFFANCCSVYFDAGIMQTYFTGVGIPHFTGKALAKLVFPLPPIAEQRRIVAKVDALMALCERLEASLTATVVTRRCLLDALLAEALTPAEDRELEAAE
ncbi:type I restriction enzyme S subunit [Bradyrhizobium sp. AZCC 1719]|uniref:restriction endonuclease subunit S n=1 Tax=Bradyrhizobium sp. AZCC 1719 TaxID=3117028 RepID=UPI002FF3F182